MIVEPAPAAPRGRRHRVAWVVGIVLPVVLLVGAVSAGVAGPRETQTRSAAPAIAQAEASPGGPSPASPGSPAPASPDAEGAPVAFPTVAADLAVLSIPDAAARIDLGTQGPFAVAGFVDAIGAYEPCAAADGDPRGDPAMCLRHARLAARADDPDLGPHLDIEIAPGTRLPPALDSFGVAGLRVPMVLVGRRGPRPDPCHPTTNECNGLFVAERVTWADGGAFAPGPVLAAHLDLVPPEWQAANLDSAETLAIGGAGTILQAALVPRSSVAWLSPAAARVMAPSPAATLVWYVLGLETGYDPTDPLHGIAPPRYSWVVVDYVTGDTLARGPERSPQP